MKYLISGGGTGGHIFPAVSIANALRELDPEAEILFVGALGRMEMERVPQAGYKIIGLPVRGFYRKQMWKNIGVLWDLLRSLIQARRIVRDFRPDVGIGVGGYASGAAMWVAGKMGVPILIQEQNGFAGVTNKILRNIASKICVAYEGMERFFPKEKLILTGNPVRQNLTTGQADKDAKHPRLLVIGGSLGARTINEAIKAGIERLEKAGIYTIWQTGKYYYQDCKDTLDAYGQKHEVEHIEVHDFLSDMPEQYANADLVISRAGASSISEICLLGKASILVPSPNVTEDHQTHNAMALVNKDAAVMIRDWEAGIALVDRAIELINCPDQLKTYETNVRQLAQTDSANRIAREVIALAHSR